MDVGSSRVTKVSLGFSRRQGLLMPHLPSIAGYPIRPISVCLHILICLLCLGFPVAPAAEPDGAILPGAKCSHSRQRPDRRSVAAARLCRKPWRVGTVLFRHRWTYSEGTGRRGSPVSLSRTSVLEPSGSAKLRVFPFRNLRLWLPPSFVCRTRIPPPA
jgi:hypothetical protein